MGATVMKQIRGGSRAAATWLPFAQEHAGEEEGWLFEADGLRDDGYVSTKNDKGEIAWSRTPRRS